MSTAPETLQEPKTVDGSDLAGMLLAILTEYVGEMAPEHQAAIARHRKMAGHILSVAKAHGDAAPLLGMLIEALTYLTEVSAPADDTTTKH
ncbi:MAG TPA: hypothetical protein VGD46_15690 [Rhizobacter sp.]